MEVLKTIMSDKGWKISELAWKLKTPEQTVRAWISGKRRPTDEKINYILQEAGLGHYRA